MHTEQWAHAAKYANVALELLDGVVKATADLLLLANLAFERLNVQLSLRQLVFQIINAVFA
jgi:hypothetical protein